MPLIKVEKRDVLSFDEVNGMISSAKTLQVRTMVAILYLVGCRVNELIKLRRCDIVFDDKYMRIKVFYSKKKGSASPILDKHELLIGLNSPFVQYIREYYNTLPSDDSILFPTYRDKVWRQVKALNTNAWLHLFRHTRLTRLAEAGATEAQLAVWAGWADGRPAKSYIQRSAKLIEPLADKIR